MSNRYTVAVNRSLINKPEPKTIAKYWDTWKHEEVTILELIETIKQGYAFCPIKFVGKKVKANFKSSRLVVLDFDEWNLDEAMKNPDFLRLCTFAYTTPSHKDQQHRFRAVIQLEEEITSLEDYELLLKSTHELFDKADRSCKDAARSYFGSKDCQIIRLEGMMTAKEANRLIKNMKLALKKKPKKPIVKGFASIDAQAISRRIDVKEAEKMLSYIDPLIGYAIWIIIVWALQSYFGNEIARDLIEGWSPDYKHDGAEIDKLFEKNDGRISIGSVIYLAMQKGYQLPDSLKRRRNAELVAYEDLFGSGFGYVCIAGNLYQYEDGYYKIITDDESEQRICDYFTLYEPEAGNPKYANMACVDRALRFVKAKCRVNPDSINPIGINLNNGYLKLSYGEQREPVFELIPHSPNVVFTYKSKVDYDPDADSTILDEALNSMLSKESQVIILRSVAATFDIQTVRIKQGRIPRTLLLYGQGSNGKDTQRTWFEHLFGEHGFSHVALQAFQAADSGKLFGLYPLVLCKLNWASENTAANLDNLQTLKNVTTGDPITLEQKHKDPFTFKPRVLLMFNVNTLPTMEGTQEAISSRYGVIHFKNVFKSKPDPNNKYEKQADPRIKEDPEFISKHILPALLNKLVMEFKNVLREGIDFSSNDDLMQDIREKSSHFAQFLEDYKLRECNLEKGLTPSEAYNLYSEWCIDQKITHKDSFGNIRHNDSSFNDKVIRDMRQMTSRLRDFYPGLIADKVSGVRKLNINVDSKGLLEVQG